MCDGGYPDIYNKKLLKTRKSHKCIECRETVAAGNPMHRVESLYEGDWLRHYTCQDCEAIREHIFKLDPEADMCHGELYECLQFGYLDSDWQPVVWWLQPQTGGRFKLAKIPVRRSKLKIRQKRKAIKYCITS